MIQFISFFFLLSILPFSNKKFCFSTVRSFFLSESLKMNDDNYLFVYLQIKTQIENIWTSGEEHSPQNQKKLKKLNFQQEKLLFTPLLHCCSLNCNSNLPPNSAKQLRARVWSKSTRQERKEVVLRLLQGCKENTRIRRWHRFQQCQQNQVTGPSLSSNVNELLTHSSPTFGMRSTRLSNNFSELNSSQEEHDNHLSSNLHFEENSFSPPRSFGNLSSYFGTNSNSFFEQYSQLSPELSPLNNNNNNNN